MPDVLFCILFNAIVSAIPAVFMQNIIAVIEQSYQSGDWEAVAGKILGMAAILAILYAVSLILYLLPFVGSDHTGFFEKTA